jgi:hypothetical protein
MSFVTRRSWILFAATAIAFAVSLLYWLQDRPSRVHAESGQLAAQWGLSEEFGPPPDAEWAAVGEFCTAALGLSLLVDFIAARRKRS